MRKPEKPSELEFHLQCALRIYRDSAAICDLSPSSITKDCEALSTRARQEGMSFLTKTLPSLGKALDKSLSSDSPLQPPSSFALSKRTGHPVFLGELWSQIYDVHDPWDTPDEVIRKMAFDSWWDTVKAYMTQVDARVAAVRAVRQICFLFYKLEGAHSPESEVACLQNFVHTDALLPEADEFVDLREGTRRAVENARVLVSYILSGCREPMAPLDLLDIRPKHGPGAVATGEKTRGKYHFKRYYPKLDEMYPYADYFFYSYTHLCDELESLEDLVETPEATAKVVLVPKDSRGPRIISMEPLELQWIQQGQMRALVKYLERHSVTCGHVNFTDQEVNRGLALSNSIPGANLVTMDMKDASDRVSVWLVKQILPENVFDALMASRSDQTQLPNGDVIRLKKFAPMGSAVCFPVEALLFWAIAVGTIHDIRCARDIRKVPSVYVYGDDIIVRKEHYAAVCRVYEDLFLRVNYDKCCVGSLFRESCGMDAYNNVCVTPIRHRKHFTVSSPPALLAYVAYYNAHMAMGHKQVAAYIKGRLVSEFGQIPLCNVPGKFPLGFVDEELSNQDVVRKNSAHFKRRFNKALQRWEFRVLAPFCPDIHQGQPDWLEMMRSGTMGSFQDPWGVSTSHFEPCRYNLAKQTKLRWVWTDESQLAGK